METPKPGTKLTPSDHIMISQVVLKLAPIPEGDLQEFIGHLTVSEYARQQAFARAGEHCDRVGLVLSGLFRVYYPTAEGTEEICNFHSEGALIGSYSALISGQPSRTTTEALENSRVVWLPHSALVTLYDRHPHWQKLGRRVAEILYVEMVTREETLVTLSAEERLKEFRSRYPQLIHRIRKADLASYLGIRPETLSRLIRPNGRHFGGV